MTIRRLSFLQWLGLLAGAGVWFASFIGGLGVSQAACNPASGRWGIPYDTVQIAITAVAGALVLGAGLAAAAVFRATRGTGEQDPPPHGRLHFFAAAAMLSNLLFLAIILLAGIATIVERTCLQG